MAAENVLKFFHGDLRSKSFAVFQEMRENGQLVDVTIRVDDVVFPVHRLVLSAAIPYFRTMFTGDTSESKMKDITMKEIDPVALKVLIDYAYTNKVKITEENVESLLLTSEFLQFTEVSKSCCCFLSTHFTPDNVISIETLAKRLNCSDLIENAHRYIQKNFDAICETPEFLSVPFEFLNDLIRRDHLFTANEEKVFEAVIKWVKVDAERTVLLPELLTGVRMSLVSPDYLVEKVSKEELIRSSFPCRDLVDEAKHYHLLLKQPIKFNRIGTKGRCYTMKKHACYEYTLHDNVHSRIPRSSIYARYDDYYDDEHFDYDDQDY